MVFQMVLLVRTRAAKTLPSRVWVGSGRHKAFLEILCWTPNSNPPNTATSNLSKELVDFLTKSACDRVQGVGRGSTKKGSCKMVLWRLMTEKTSPKRKPTWPSKFAIYELQLGTNFGSVLATLRRHKMFFGALCWTPNSNPLNTATSNLSKEFVDFLTKSTCGRLQGGPWWGPTRGPKKYPLAAQGR